MKRITIIILYVLKFILSIKIHQNISFNGNSYKSSFYSGNNNGLFQIIYNNTLASNYLKIEIKDILAINSNPKKYVISFSSDDEECLEGREQMSQSKNGEAVMWIKREQTEKKHNYISIQCSLMKCGYTLTLSSYKSIEMDLDSHYTYYVTEETQEMNFLINKVSDFFYQKDYDYITLWAIGKQKVVVGLPENDFDLKKNSYKEIYKIKLEKNSQFSLSVRGNLGDLIDVGSNTVGNRMSNNNKIIINDPEKQGYLIKDFSKEDCYYLEKNDLYKKSEEFYLSVFVQTKIAEIYFNDKDGKEIEDSITIINNFSFIKGFNPQKINFGSICIRFPSKEKEIYEIKNIVYSIQVTDPKQADFKMDLFSLQFGSVIYPRLIQNGDIILLGGMPQTEGIKKITYNLISNSGNSTMFIADCQTYPLCEYNQSNLSTLIHPYMVNDISSWTEEINPERTPISSKQKIMIIKCIEGKYKGEGAYEPCSFNTIINNELDVISLKENELFSKYIISKEKDNYIVDYSGEKNIQKIYIDLLIHTGDVAVNILSKIEIHKYIILNKIFLVLTVDQNIASKVIFFNVEAIKNSYYSLSFTPVRNNEDSWVTNKIKPGINYLLTIDPNLFDQSGKNKPYKIIKFNNTRLSDDLPFFVNFYSLNCKLNVTNKKLDQYNKEIYTPIYSFGLYSQDITFKNSSFSNSLSHVYKLDIKEAEDSNYDKKQCIVYTSSLELGVNKEKEIKEIIINENVPQQIIFKKELKEIKYLYPHSNLKNDVVLRFSLIDRAKYSFNLWFDSKPSLNNYSDITGNNIIFISHLEWENICINNHLCPITMKIKCDSSFLEEEPKLEVLVKNFQDNSPTYIQKNIVRTDYINGDKWKFYFTHLGIGEKGNILINFNRGSGQLFGKIVSKNSTEAEEGAEWRMMYKFPRTQNESLNSINYNQITFPPTDSYLCKEGCYLLISLKKEKENITDNRGYPFNILINTIPENRSQENTPIIFLPLNEYIISNIESPEDHKIYQFFSVIFPHDSEKIIIDFQSYSACLFINVNSEGKRPEIEDYDFKFEIENENNIFEISKEDFIQKAQKRGMNIPIQNSLKGLSMIIGLYPNKSNYLFSTIFSIRVNLFLDKELNIYDINTDQKVLCKTMQIEDNPRKNRCLYMVHYSEIELSGGLILFPLIQDKTAIFEIYANFIEKEKYFLYNKKYIEDNIPNENSKYSTKETKYDYLYINKSETMNGFLFVSIILNKPTVVELMSSFYIYGRNLVQNPSISQLFLVKEKLLNLNFIFYKDYLININSIKGEAEIYWELEPEAKYFLEGRDKHLLFSSKFKNESEIEKDSSKLVFNNLYTDNNKNVLSTCPGFVFYLDYKQRSSTYNLNELSIGISYNFPYIEGQFPLFFYAILPKKIKGINAFITFYDLISIKGSEFNEKIYLNEHFEINATVVEESILFNSKMLSSFIPKNFCQKIGIYEPSLKTLYVNIQPKDFEIFNINETLNPYILLTIGQENQITKKIYDRVNMECTINVEDSTLPISENIYQYGKLNLDEKENIYILKSNFNKHTMIIHFSSNGNFLDWAVSSIKGSHKNDTFQKEKIIKNNEKIIFFFDVPINISFIYLTIFHKEPKTINDNLTNYVFKYINLEDEGLYKHYKIEDPSIKVNKVGNQKKEDNVINQYELSINPILNYQKLITNYIIKVASKEDIIPYENISSIAISHSNYRIKEFINPPVNKNNKITLDISEIEVENKYIQVIAQIREREIIEYVTYNVLYFDSSKEVNENNIKKFKNILIIIIAGIVILLALAIGIIICCKIKNRRNSLSFQIESLFKLDGELENGSKVSLLNNNELG